jgi:hypothetical protein
VADGKRVKCPKCGAPFTAPGLVEDEEERPRKKVSGKKGQATIKKAVAPKPSPKKPAPEEDGDEDAGGGIYSYAKENEQEEEDKPEIVYAPDMSIKDLRGPAQAVLVKPSNYLLLIGGVCCILDILIICVCFWPMVFSEHLFDHEEFLAKHHNIKIEKKKGDEIEGNPLTSRAAPTPQQDGKKTIPKERKDLSKEDLALVEEAEGWGFIWPSFIGRGWRFSLMGMFIALLIYNGITIMGAVKMQNLESRGWGIASSIMTLLPFGAASIAVAVAFVFYLLFAMLLDDEKMGWMYAGGTSVLVWVLTIVVGVWSLRVLMSQEVIDGFEYVAE